MSRLGELVEGSIKRLKAFEPRNGEGYFLAFSGGKDSVVTKALMDMAGVKYDAHYSISTVDPPELVHFIMEKHPDVAREHQYWPNKADKQGKPIPYTMWNLIPKKGVPTQIKRYCCAKLKEGSGDGRYVVTGVRWAESINRKKNQSAVTVTKTGSAKEKQELVDSSFFAETRRGGVVLVEDNAESRQMIENCVKRGKVMVNPIIDWEDKDVWDFIRSENIPYCGLYDEGYERLGCIGCPMARTAVRYKDFASWPKYKENYLKAIQRFLDNRGGEMRIGNDQNRVYRTAEEVFHWWVRDGVIPNQIGFFDYDTDD